jgi:hypothetical protein
VRSRGDNPYLFPVESAGLSEAYLRTLHDAHYASHTAYKQQFLHDLTPALPGGGVRRRARPPGVGPTMGPVRS